MDEYDDAHVGTLLMVNMQANTRSVTIPLSRPTLAPTSCNLEPPLGL